MSEEFDARAKAEAMGEKVNLLERIQGYGMPDEVVTVYLDMKSEYKRQQAERAAADVADDPEKLAAIEAQIERYREAARASRVDVHLVGLSTENYDEIVDELNEEFPLEYEEHYNPLTGRKERVALETEERQLQFLRSTWARSIQRVEMNGGYDDEIDVAWVTSFQKILPLEGVRKIQAKIEELRMVGNWMDALEGPDFS